MAGKGRQIYLTQEEIEDIYANLEWRVISLTEEIRIVRDALHFSIEASRRAGKKPERSDFNALLPNPEQDYQFALERWNHYKNGWKIDLEEIRDLQKDRNRIHRLQNKLWYR